MKTLTGKFDAVSMIILFWIESGTEQHSSTQKDSENKIQPKHSWKWLLEIQSLSCLLMCDLSRSKSGKLYAILMSLLETRQLWYMNQIAHC
jgi:hypothetical protein